MTQLWAVEMAEAFWAEAGIVPVELPRELRRAIAFAVPLAVVDMPRPRVAAVNRWLAQRGIEPLITQADRPLRACLVVRGGSGIVFLDGADPDDERRFSLAHEVAHFWLEYHAPRRDAERRLGPGVVEVLDGARRPTAAERVGAALAGVPLGPRVHLMERDTRGGPLEAGVTLAERRADALAVELLAPIDLVLARIDGRRRRAHVQAVLREAFGLPESVAARYADRLAPERPGKSFVEHVRGVALGPTGGEQ